MSAERQQWVKGVTATSSNVSENILDYSSITVQRIYMKFGVDIEPNSACFSLLLGD